MRSFVPLLVARMLIAPVGDAGAEGNGTLTVRVITLRSLERSFLGIPISRAGPRRPLKEVTGRDRWRRRAPSIGRNRYFRSSRTTAIVNRR
jgi:hypothetical protein